MNVLLFTIFMLVIQLGYSVRIQRICSVSINLDNGDLQEPQPLLVDYGSGRANFLHPIDKMGTIRMNEGHEFVVAYPGRGNHIEGIKNLKVTNEIKAKCSMGKTFTTGKISFDFSKLKCKFLPVSTARRSNDYCYKDATKIKIGFQLKNDFLTTIDVCRNTRTLMTLWARSTMTPAIAAFQGRFPRPAHWEKGDFFHNYNMDSHYNPNSQKKMIAKLLNSQQAANHYINFNSELYIAKGHLVAKSDFVYGTAQSSTFWYLNTAPQWQTFNGGNWNALELGVRKFAARKTSPLEIYTGTHGQMGLINSKGQKVPVFLHAGKRFPVPKFFWKIIYDPRTKRGTAFVGLNDPFANSITQDMYLCRPITTKISWLWWDPMNIGKGFSYVCDVNDLRRSVPHVPNVPVTGILL